MSLLIRGELERPSGFRLTLNLDLPSTGVTAIIGASGSGKSTLLRIVAGLEPEAEFEVSLDGQSWDNGLAAHQRPISFVTQDSTLFPHLNVARNLALVRRQNPEHTFNEVVNQFEIGALLEQMPDQLSGGQKQRVGLARAMLKKAVLWMFDEPLSSLDSRARQYLAPLILETCNNLNQPVLYVTHSLQEVLPIADHLLVLEKGEVIASGTPADVGQQIDHPISEHIDVGCIVHCTFINYDTEHELSELALGGQSLWLRGDLSQHNQPIRLQIPARDISVALTADDPSSVLNKLTCHLKEISKPQNGSVLLSLDCDRQTLFARITTLSLERLSLTPGQLLIAYIKSVALNAN